MTSFSSPVMMTSLGASFHSSSIMTSSSHKFGSGRPDSTSPSHTTTTTTPNSVSSTEAARNFLNQFNISHALHPPSQVELRESGSGSGLGVWATEVIPAGSKFGPFLGKWCLEPLNQNQAWEVSPKFLEITSYHVFSHGRMQQSSELSVQFWRQSSWVQFPAIAKRF